MVNVRVLLVDDDALVRAGLRMILSAVQDLQVVGKADDGWPRSARTGRTSC
jgi:DNA-binding NarL/FixJ family response regulator